MSSNVTQGMAADYRDIDGRAVASTMLSYVLPASIHLRVRRHRMASLRKNGATAAFLVMGTVCGLVALVNHTIDVLA